MNRKELKIFAMQDQYEIDRIITKLIHIIEDESLMKSEELEEAIDGLGDDLLGMASGIITSAKEACGFID